MATRTKSDAKTVLFIAPIFPPTVGAGTHRTVRFVKYLAVHGYNVIVITKTCPSSETETAEESCQRLRADGLEVVQIDAQTTLPKSSVAATSGQPSQSRANGSKHVIAEFAKRLVRPIWQLISETPDSHRHWSARAAKTAIELTQSRSIDLIYTSGPPHSVHLAGRKVARKTNTPLILDFRDPWGRKSWQKNKNPLGRRWFPWLERRAVLSSSHVIVNNSAALESFRTAYHHDLPKSHFSSITNGFDPDEFSEIQAAAFSVPRRTENEDVILLHAGSLYGERNPLSLVCAVRKLRAEGVPVHFRQIGHCDIRFDLMTMAENLGCPDAVSMIPVAPRGDVIKEMARADIHVLLQPNAPQQVPGKLFEMLMFNQPILAIGESLPTEALVERMGGCCVNSSDVPAITSAIRRAIALAGEPGLQERRSSARQSFDARELTKSLALVFDTVLSASPSRRGGR